MSDFSRTILFVERQGVDTDRSFSVTVGTATGRKEFKGFSEKLLDEALDACRADDMVQMHKDSLFLEAGSKGSKVPLPTVRVSGEGPDGRLRHIRRNAGDSFGFVTEVSVSEVETILLNVLAAGTARPA